MHHLPSSCKLVTSVRAFGNVKYNIITKNVSNDTNIDHLATVREMRPVILICLILTHSCFTNVLSPTSAAAVTGVRSTGSGSGLSTCRCTPDQFEAVLKSVEREIDLQFGSRSEAENVDYEELSAAVRANDAEEGARDDERLPIAGPMAVEAESSTSVHYDYTNGLLATIEEAGRVKTIVDHQAVC